MNMFEAVSVVVGLAALRFAVPLALSLGVTYGMNRMADRWQLE